MMFGEGEVVGGLRKGEVMEKKTQVGPHGHLLVAVFMTNVAHIEVASLAWRASSHGPSSGESTLQPMGIIIPHLPQS